MRFDPRNTGWVQREGTAQKLSLLSEEIKTQVFCGLEREGGGRREGEGGREEGRRRFIL